MRTYARLEGCTVAEIIRTDVELERLYHPAIAWVDVTDLGGVTEGWRNNDGTLQPPQLDASTAPRAAPSVADLMARIEALHAEITLMVESGAK